MKKNICIFIISAALAASGCRASNPAITSILESSENMTVVETTSDTTVIGSTLSSVSETASESITETEKQSFTHEYGVFLSFEGKLDKLADYHTVVIDAQYYGKEEIESFKNKGHKVISYINIGSLENFRSYYKKYKGLKLGKYEHWDEEIWIDVSDQKWQDFITGEMIPNLVGKGIDGFFVDNCDVYYHFPAAKILNGLTNIMKTMINTGKDVLINGGDTYLDAYCKSGGSWNDVITGINQENVFAKIIWDKNKFGKAEPEDHEYFIGYIERYSKLGAKIYLLEYTKDKNLINEIDEYCKQNGFEYYVSDSVELD